jgi:predicted dehydrogenase
MKIAVLGYGFIGRERVRALVRLRDEDGLISKFAVFDPYATDERPKIEALGGCWCVTLDAVRAFAPDWVVIAVPHDQAVELCIEVLSWGVRILMEKPFGRSLAEAEQLACLAGDPTRIAIGFNYRFFPGITAALSDVRAGRLGELVSVNMLIGHGGSPGMERSWKFNPERAGSGVLLDPGVHMIDLCHCLAPDVVLRHYSNWSGFWKTGITEEANLILRAGRTVFNLQLSVVHWRSTFRIELNGTDGYGVVAGRGRSYGAMKYVRGRRWGWQNAANQEASEEVVNISDCDDSFRDEMRALFLGVTGWPAPCFIAEALLVMRTYESCKVADG